MSWREIQLGDAIRVKHGFAFESQYFADSGSFLVLTPGNFNEEGGFRLRPSKDRFYSADVPAGYLLDAGDLIVAMTEQGPGLLGSAAMIPQGGKYLHNQRLGLVREIDTKVLDKCFLYYLFNTRSVRAQISGSATGTKVRHTAPKRIYQVKVTVPSDVGLQRRIASFLSAYDDLIENNGRRIQLLERAARIVYEEWFVRLRFPGQEHVTITGGMPEGWERKKIAEVCETIGGGTPSTKVSEYWDGDIPWVVPSDVTKNDCFVLLDSERKITEKGLRESSAKMVPATTILMTSRASVGFLALVDTEVCTNQGFINIVLHNEETRLYLFFNLVSRVDEIRSNAKGTTYPEISKARFRGMDLALPPSSLTRQFAEVAGEFLQQVRCLKRSVCYLTKARDLVLLRLMNGEITV